MAKYTGDVPPVAHAELIHSVIQRVATGPELSFFNWLTHETRD